MRETFHREPVEAGLGRHRKWVGPSRRAKGAPRPERGRRLQEGTESECPMDGRKELQRQKGGMGVPGSPEARQALKERWGQGPLALVHKTGGEGWLGSQTPPSCT